MSSSNKPAISILFPYYEDTKYSQLSETTCHDLGLDTIVGELTDNEKDRVMILSILSNMTADPRVTEYRREVFIDFLNLPEMRVQMMELFEKIQLIRDYKTVRRDRDEKLGMWDLMHRLDEINEYITYIESMRECLSSSDIKSGGLLALKEYIDGIYEEACFAEMKKDIAGLKSETHNIRSVTVGINLNERFEASALGLISINDKPFKKSNIVSNFADAIASGGKIHHGNDWNGDMHFNQVETSFFASKLTTELENLWTVQNAPFIDARVRSTVVNVAMNDGIETTPFYLDKIVNKMLDSLLKKLRDTLSRYTNIAVVNITKLIPEFIYYISFADFIEKHMKRGLPFCEATLITDDDNKCTSMEASGLYNIKLAISVEDPESIVSNDLDFNNDHTIYILTGANRGGKTTITQAVGQLFVLAQGGIYVPCKSFRYKGVDCIYTHFPADEDKTMDLGRLGEECVRFKELYGESTAQSLLLLNETFSTTSFEEGYYIAKDSIRAVLRKGTRTIYNTHMHKIAADIEELNSPDNEAKAASLIMKNDGSKRSFKVEVAAPEGMSYARDIAEKYGVTYEMLTEE